MLNQLVSNSITSGKIEMTNFLICTLASLILGLVSSFIYMYKNKYSKSFVITLAILPAMVQIVIMLVNGNLGTGVAVMGAFSLVRFRSVAGSAKEISSIFLAMAIGLSTGMGYIGVAIIFLGIIGVATILLSNSKFGEQKETEKQLKIVIPESLDYTEVFDDIFEKYTTNVELVKVKTTNMGSLYELFYDITLKEIKNEKKFIDELRCRNGNLNILCSRVFIKKDEL